MTYLMLFSDGDLAPDVLILLAESQMPSSLAAFLSHSPGAPVSALKTQMLVVAGGELYAFLFHVPGAPVSALKSQTLADADYEICTLLSSC